MTITELRYFITTCNFNNISKTAAFYHVSQPAVSNAIKEMEEEFGVRLFVRNNNRLVITEEGRFFLKYATGIIEKVDETEALMKDHGKQKKLLTVGVPPIIGTFLFPNLVNGFMKENPNVQFSITETGSLKVLSLVETNQVDLGVISYSGEMSKKFVFIELLDTEFVFAVNRNHPLAKRAKIRLEDLNGEQVILYSVGSYQNQYINDKMNEKGIKPTIFLHSSQLATILEFLKNPDVGAFLHKEIVDKNEGIIGIPFVEPIKIKIGIVYNKQSGLLSLPQKFVEYCKEKYIKIK